MDLETENRIVAMLMKEAAELRRQAERDGVDVYLKPPNVRGRPNSRFLTATVLSVQQANRVVEVNEMWRTRQKEKELDDKVKKNNKRSTYDNASSSRKITSTSGPEDCERKSMSMCSSSKRGCEDDGLRDKEIEEFLHSRVKRGRGAVGSRMDETGPYLPSSNEKHEADANELYRESRAIFGPKKPLNLKSTSDSYSECFGHRKKSSKHNLRKHISKEKSRDIKKKKREKRRGKYHK